MYYFCGTISFPMKKNLTLPVLLLSATVAFGQNTALDSAFGTYGKAIFTYSGTNGFLSLQQTNDNKIVAGGYAQASFSQSSFMLARVDTAGRPDNTFGVNGFKIMNLTASSRDRINAVDIQSDNKIIAAGYSNATGVNTFTLVRLNTDGSLDNTFGTGGIVYTTIGTTCKISRMLLQPDGKILAGGVTTTGTNSDFALARYNTDGSLDNTFGTGGIVTAGFNTNSQDSLADIVLQSDGKIVGVGSTLLPTGIYGYYQMVMRFNTDGTPDNTFGTGGMAFQNTGNFNFITTSVALQPDNKILAATRVGNMHSTVYLSRYNSDGTVDATFGTVLEASTGRRGIETFLSSFNSNAQSFPNTLQVRPNGKILIGGNYDMAAALKQVKTDGTTDSTFGLYGAVTTVTPPYYRISQMRLLPDGRILTSIENMSGTGSGIIRFRATGSGGSTLPITLTQFSAYAQQNIARLQWSTAMEQNSDHFIIERSRDGKGFSNIGTVKAAGNSNSPVSYSFSDKGLEEGKYYYRLKQTDMDGKFTYSMVRQVQVAMQDAGMIIAPNPVHRSEGLNITLPVTAAEQVVLHISNQEGKVMKEYSYRLEQGTHVLQAGISDLAPGLYFLSVKNQQGNTLFAPQRIVIR